MTKPIFWRTTATMPTYEDIVKTIKGLEKMIEGDLRWRVTAIGYTYLQFLAPQTIEYRLHGELDTAIEHDEVLLDWRVDHWEVSIWEWNNDDTDNPIELSCKDEDLDLWTDIDNKRLYLKVNERTITYQ